MQESNSARSMPRPRASNPLFCRSAREGTCMPWVPVHTGPHRGSLHSTCDIWDNSNRRRHCQVQFTTPSQAKAGPAAQFLFQFNKSLQSDLCLTMFLLYHQDPGYSLSSDVFGSCKVSICKGVSHFPCETHPIAAVSRLSFI